MKRKSDYGQRFLFHWEINTTSTASKKEAMFWFNLGWLESQSHHQQKLEKKYRRCLGLDGSPGTTKEGGE